MNRPAAQAKSRPRILHAEDQQLVAEAISLVLSRSGYDVESVRNGAEALEKFRAQPGRYDLLLTDGNMPVLGGVQLVETLRAENFAGKIVVLSGLVNADNERAYEQLGVDGIVRKPFQIQELLKVIEQALK
ncbi:MAG: response regulator [Verrucomicrobia bacterium]|nr:response regulator [Verrucomicrobiota bacterium]